MWQKLVQCSLIIVTSVIFLSIISIPVLYMLFISNDNPQEKALFYEQFGQLNYTNGSVRVLDWLQYKKTFDKTFNSSEEETRARYHYTLSRQLVLHHNANTSLSFKIAINDLVEWAFEAENQQSVDQEKRRLKEEALESLDLNEYADEEELSGLLSNWSNDTVPQQVDWRQKANVVGPVKNQHKCGSCWAFSVTGLLEGQQHKFSNISKIIELSEQQLIDCDKSSAGCQGGVPPIAFAHINQVGGLQTEASYPYRSFDESMQFQCNVNSSFFYPSTRTKMNETKLIVRLVSAGDEELLKKVLAYYGPVSVSIDLSDPKFYLYSDGIYYNPNCSTEKLDHAMLLVGYGTTPKGQDYWIVKNSFGPSWGINGYGYLPRNRDNHCGIATIATIVIQKKVKM